MAASMLSRAGYGKEAPRDGTKPPLRRGARHAAAPPTVHSVSLAQLRRWSIRPSWSTLSWP
eukprot:4420144-Prymnesium_polylepis.1